MSVLNTNWQTSRHENLEGLIDSMGVPEETKKEWLESKYTFRITRNGDEYQLTTTLDDGKTFESCFKDGVEFEQQLDKDTSAKSVIKFEGDKSYIHVQKFSDGTTITIDNQLATEELVSTTTSNKWDSSAKVYYKSIK